MAVTDQPCYKCELRKMGCHSTCQKYISWRKELDDINAERLKKNIGIDVNQSFSNRFKKRDLHSAYHKKGK